MLTKIIIRTCIFLMLVPVFSCVREEAALPAQSSKAQLLSLCDKEVGQVHATDLDIISQEYQPTGCTFEPCSEVLPKLVKFYRQLANATCETQWYCATCCLEQQLITINGSVTPSSPACYETASTSSASAFQPVPKLDVMILPNACYQNGATLLAVNPKIPGNPAYYEPSYTVKWFRNGQQIGKGALLSDCICGEKISVTVKSNQTVQQGSAEFLPQPCQLKL